MSVLTRYIFTVVFAILALQTLAQDEDPAPRRGSKIIDDSTRNIYGPRTSRYYYEEDFFANRNATHFIDTTSWNFHKFTYVQRYNNFYQDLGNIGTAIRPIYTSVSDNIGVTSGFDAYQLYWDAETIKYYDTRSPYSNMKLMLGGKGRSVFRVTFSRNITPRWNFGFNYRNLSIDKQIQRSGKGDRNVKSTYADVYTVFHSKDSAYSLFASYRRNFQEADEYGGVLVGDEYSYSDFFLQNAQRTLTEAASNDRRENVHLFHQYRLGSGLQLYHKADINYQKNRFTDNDPDNSYYDFIEVDSPATRDQSEFKTFRNELGVKGNLLKLFYNGYAAFRKYTMDYRYFREQHLDFKTSATELYVGGRMELQLDSLITVRGWAEWMMDDRYQITGSIRTKWFEAAVKRSVSTPTFLQRAYRGSHDVWINDYANVEGTEVKGNLIYESRIIKVYPGVRFTTLRNYVFFKQDTTQLQDVLPVQSSGYQTWVSPELNFSINLAKHVNLNAQALYTKVLENSEDAIQVPDVFLNAQLSYSNIWFNGNLDFQIGVDVHWKSAYYAPGYDPVIQQFYTQQSFEVPDAPVIDLFFNAKIKRARIILRYNNMFMLFKDYGNIPTPYYPGIKNIIDFGFDWSFYD